MTIIFKKSKNYGDYNSVEEVGTIESDIIPSVGMHVKDMGQVKEVSIDYAENTATVRLIGDWGM